MLSKRTLAAITQPPPHVLAAASETAASEYEYTRVEVVIRPLSPPIDPRRGTHEKASRIAAGLACRVRHAHPHRHRDAAAQAQPGANRHAGEQYPLGHTAPDGNATCLGHTPAHRSAAPGLRAV
jgi:hypothetical protein